VEDDNTATAKRISLSELMKGDTSERAENNIIVICGIIQTENNTDREEENVRANSRRGHYGESSREYQN
jgi:hypothetical protein